MVAGAHGKLVPQSAQNSSTVMHAGAASCIKRKELVCACAHQARSPEAMPPTARIAMIWNSILLSSCLASCALSPLGA